VNILSLADTRFPIERANGVQTMATCVAMATRGHSVTLLVRPDSQSPPRDPFAFYGWPTTPSLHIDVVPTTRHLTLRRAEMLWAGLRRTLSGRFDLVFTRDLGFAALLCRIPRSNRPRLVYESHGIAPIVAAEMPALLGTPDATPSASKLERLDRRERRVWETADAYVTITQALADDLTARYGSRDRVCVVPDGARLADVAPPIAHARPIAAYSGHLYPWKGVDVFLDALALRPEWDGLIIGGHPQERDLPRVQQRLVDLGLTTRVRITGLLPQTEVAAALASADALVLPNVQTTISERYTSPLKLFEYLAAGRAIIASDLPALREVLTDGETALLVEPGQAPPLANALARLTDASTCAALAARAAALAPTFTWDRRAERLDAAFNAATHA
jgi:glycosyltransferase involved in cell wall biosynthesis